jgi:hypothetical protein
MVQLPKRRHVAFVQSATKRGDKAERGPYHESNAWHISCRYQRDLKKDPERMSEVPKKDLIHEYASSRHLLIGYITTKWYGKFFRIYRAAPDAFFADYFPDTGVARIVEDGVEYVSTKIDTVYEFVNLFAQETQPDALWRFSQFTGS